MKFSPIVVLAQQFADDAQDLDIEKFRKEQKSKFKHILGGYESFSEAIGDLIEAMKGQVASINGNAISDNAVDKRVAHLMEEQIRLVEGILPDLEYLDSEIADAGNEEY